MRKILATISMLLALSLPAACTAPATQPPGVDPPPAAGPTSPAPTPAGSVSRSCRVDADCAVKDVGSCCGRFPACVNKSARPDPAAVQAQCAKQGMSSVCGFREVAGCSCVQGSCQDVGSGPQVR